MEQTLRMVQRHLASWISSSILEVEIARNPDEERRNDVNSLLVFANEVVRRRQRMLIGRRNFKTLALARLTPCIWLVRNGLKSTCFSPLMTDCSVALAATFSIPGNAYVCPQLRVSSPTFRLPTTIRENRRRYSRPKSLFGDNPPRRNRHING
jgi:hypothetical protein